MDPTADSRALVVAFYLPQFHPIPENDAWWGQGFTEWTSVVQAVPLFEGHYQPHLPADLGFYDLRLPEVRELQADIAVAHGIDAFCYYHYWFGGRPVLHRPFDEVLRTGRPVLPFMLCWANENWTRAWDAGTHEVLLEQSYDAEERADHVTYLVKAFSDDRYLRVDDRPVFAIYRIGGLPGASAFVTALRERAQAEGVGDPLIVKFDTHGNFDHPADFGCDVAAQFFPHGSRELGLEDRQIDVGAPGNLVVPYDEVVRALLDCPAPTWNRYECVTPSWDNTPCRGDGRSWIVHGSTPEAYEQWLGAVLERAPGRTDGQPIVFVNGWNEWAEGAHLEPDLRWGDAYLRATARAVLGREPVRPIARPDTAVPEPADPEERYRDLYDRYVQLQQRFSELDLAAQRRLDRTAADFEAKLLAEHEVALRLAEQLERRLASGPADDDR